MRRKARTIEEVREFMRAIGPIPSLLATLRPISTSESNLTRTAEGPFDPDKSWVDQVLATCPLDSKNK